jgi:MATE family multidrug resistance protein
VIHIFSYVVVMMPLAWWLGVKSGGGVDGLIWAIIIASALSAVLLWGRFMALGRAPLTPPDAAPASLPV